MKITKPASRYLSTIYYGFSCNTNDIKYYRQEAKTIERFISRQTLH